METTSAAINIVTYFKQKCRSAYKIDVWEKYWMKILPILDFSWTRQIVFLKGCTDLYFRQYSAESTSSPTYLPYQVAATSSSFPNLAGKGELLNCEYYTDAKVGSLRELLSSSLTICLCVRASITSSQYSTILYFSSHLIFWMALSKLSCCIYGYNTASCK